MGKKRPRETADAGLAVLVLSLGVFLTASGAQLAQRLHTSAARRQSFSFEDHIGVAANTVGLVVVVWWALSFLIAVAAALLERSGSRRAAAATGRFAPAFMRRLALAVVGLQLVSAPWAQAAHGPADPPGQATATPPAAAAAWVPSGGTLTPGTAPPPTAAAPTPAPPAPSPRQGSLGLDPHWTPAPVPVDPGALATGPLRKQDPTASVTVRTGDSLWSLSAAALGPLASDLDIAMAWPRLYDANRSVIGPDPGLLLPGQVLKLPAGL